MRVLRITLTLGVTLLQTVTLVNVFVNFENTGGWCHINRHTSTCTLVLLSQFLKTSQEICQPLAT